MHKDEPPKGKRKASVVAANESIEKKLRRTMADERAAKAECVAQGEAHEAEAVRAETLLEHLGLPLDPAEKEQQ